MPQRLISKTMVFAFVNTCPDYFPHIPKKYRTREICLIAVQSYGQVCEHIPPELQSEGFFLEAVKRNANGKALKYIPDEYRTLAVCKAALRRHGDKREELLGYVPESLKELMGKEEKP